MSTFCSDSVTRVPLARSSAAGHRERRSDAAPESYGARCVMTMDVPVIVNVAVRSGPVLAATVNWTVPSPEPDAP
jgi:hypothetical protein